MKTSTMVFIVVMILVLLLGTYYIVKANKPPVTAYGPSASEPTANIWTVVGGLIDVFKSESEPESSQEAEGFGDTGGTFGPPQY